MNESCFAPIGIRTKKIYKKHRADDGFCELLDICIGIPEFGEEGEQPHFKGINEFFERLAYGYLSYLEKRLLPAIKEEYSALEEVRLRRRFAGRSAALKYSFSEAEVMAENKKKTGRILSVCMDFSVCRERRILEYRREAVNIWIYDHKADGVLISDKMLKNLLFQSSSVRIGKADGYYFIRDKNGAPELHAYKNLSPDLNDKKLQISDFAADEVLFSGE